MDNETLEVIETINFEMSTRRIEIKTATTVSLQNNATNDLRDRYIKLDGVAVDGPTGTAATLYIRFGAEKAGLASYSRMADGNYRLDMGLDPSDLAATIGTCQMNVVTVKAQTREGGGKGDKTVEQSLALVGKTIV